MGNFCVWSKRYKFYENAAIRVLGALSVMRLQKSFFIYHILRELFERENRQYIRPVSVYELRVYYRIRAYYPMLNNFVFRVFGFPFQAERFKATGDVENRRKWVR